MKIFLCPFRQVGNNGHIVYIGRGGFHLVDKSGVTVYADVPLVAEVPLVALLDLMCIGIPFLLLLQYIWSVSLTASQKTDHLVAKAVRMRMHRFGLLLQGLRVRK